MASPRLRWPTLLPNGLSTVPTPGRGGPRRHNSRAQSARLMSLSLLFRVDRAVTRVYQLAIADFTNSKLTASCAAFVEMLSRDSTLLRVDTQTASRLLLYQEFLQKNGDVSSKEGEREQHRLASKTKIGRLCAGIDLRPVSLSIHLSVCLFISLPPSLPRSLAPSLPPLAASQLTQLHKTPDNMTLAMGILHKVEKATICLIEASRVGRCALKSGE